MFLIGLTGGIASGKSTVSQMFQDLGCLVIDADKLARQIVEPGEKAWIDIRHHFGDDILLENGCIDRDTLGQIIFQNPEKRKLLNSLTHPRIHKAMVWEVLKCFFKGYQFVILDIPLLFETKTLLSLLECTILVYCDPHVQLQRLMHRNKYLEDEAQQRINAQMPLMEKLELATHVIDNSVDVDRTNMEVQRLYEMFRTSRAHWKIRGLLLLGITAIVGSISYTLLHLFRWISSNV